MTLITFLQNSRHSVELQQLEDRSFEKIFNRLEIKGMLAVKLMYLGINLLSKDDFWKRTFNVQFESLGLDHSFEVIKGIKFFKPSEIDIYRFIDPNAEELKSLEELKHQLQQLKQQVEESKISYLVACQTLKTIKEQKKEISTHLRQNIKWAYGRKTLELAILGSVVVNVYKQCHDPAISFKLCKYL